MSRYAIIRSNETDAHLTVKLYNRKIIFYVSSIRKRALSSDGKLDIDKVIIVNSKKKKRETIVYAVMLSMNNVKV